MYERVKWKRRSRGEYHIGMLISTPSRVHPSRYWNPFLTSNYRNSCVTHSSYALYKMHMYSTSTVANYLYKYSLLKLVIYIYIYIHTHVYTRIIMDMYDHINILESNLYISYIYKLSYLE